MLHPYYPVLAVDPGTTIPNSLSNQVGPHDLFLPVKCKQSETLLPGWRRKASEFSHALLPFLLQLSANISTLGMLCWMKMVEPRTEGTWCFKHCLENTLCLSGTLILVFTWTRNKILLTWGLLYMLRVCLSQECYFHWSRDTQELEVHELLV